MNALTRWNPFRELDEMQGRLSRWFERPSGRENGLLSDADWAPPVDITEDEKEYVIKAELPDIPKDQVKVSVENGTLVITGERRFEKEEKERKYHRIERSYGSFARSFGLPDDADASKIEAKFNDGVLTVHLGKNDHAKPKRIDVNVT